MCFDLLDLLLHGCFHSQAAVLAHLDSVLQVPPEHDLPPVPAAEVATRLEAMQQQFDDPATDDS